MVDKSKTILIFEKAEKQPSKQLYSFYHADIDCGTVEEWRTHVLKI